MPLAIRPLTCIVKGNCFLFECLSLTCHLHAHVQGGKLDDITVVVACVVEEDVPVVEDVAPPAEPAEEPADRPAASAAEDAAPQPVP